MKNKETSLLVVIAVTMLVGAIFAIFIGTLPGCDRMPEDSYCGPYSAFDKCEDWCPSEPTACPEPPKCEEPKTCPLPPPRECPACEECPVCEECPGKPDKEPGNCPHGKGKCKGLNK